MVTHYVDPASGSDGNAGTSWGLAKASLQGAIDIATGGDVINVANTSADTLSALINWTSYTDTNSQTNWLTIQGANPGSGTLTIAHPDGDIDAGVIDGNDFGANMFATSSMPGYVIFKNMVLKNVTGMLFDSTTAANFWAFHNCEFTNLGHASQGCISTEVGHTFVGCYVHDWHAGAAFVELASKDCLLAGCYFDSTGSGGPVVQGSAGGMFIDNIVQVGSDNGLEPEGRNFLIAGNTFIGSGGTSSWGIKMISSSLHWVFNNIFQDFNGASGGGIDYNSLGATAVGPNLFYNCTTNENARVTGVSMGNDVANDPGFASKANDDFNPSEQTYAKEAAWPAGIIGTSAGAATGTTNYRDLGAAQRQEPAGGGVGPLPRMVVSGRRPVY